MNTYNLMRLAVHLENLPENYEHFDMADYVTVLNDDYTGHSPNDVTSDVVNACGTVACALGHAPLLMPALPDENWADYVERVFDIDSMDIIWDWLFESDWRFYDNTPHGAAKRIRYLVENGDVPANFEQPEEKFVELYA